jgi:hypothetical protein
MLQVLAFLVLHLLAQVQHTQDPLMRKQLLQLAKQQGLKGLVEEYISIRQEVKDKGLPHAVLSGR